MTDQDKNFNYAALINREMEILDYKSMMKQKLEEGREEGREEGEEHKACEIARRMLEEKFDLETIARISGLSAEQIKAL